jgi:hypothetical protein
MATFNVQLPDFFNSETVALRAYVNDAPVGVHDIILGTHVCQQQRLVHWDDLSMVVKDRGTINKTMLNAVNKDDGLPIFCNKQLNF